MFAPYFLYVKAKVRSYHIPVEINGDFTLMAFFVMKYGANTSKPSSEMKRRQNGPKSIILHYSKNRFLRFGKPLEKLTLNREKKKRAVENVPRSTNAPHCSSDQIQDLGDSLKFEI